MSEEEIQLAWNEFCRKRLENIKRESFCKEQFLIWETTITSPHGTIIKIKEYKSNPVET